MLLQVLSLAVAACLFGLVASVIVYRASHVAPVWNIVIALLVVLVLTATALAIFLFIRDRAFQN
jgi:hypothetical protein